MTMILRDFVNYLQQQDPRLSQCEVARRAKVSQSTINKIVIQIGSRMPNLDTYKAVTGAFPTEWRAYLASHPEARRELARDFGWAVAANPLAEGPDDPLSREILAEASRVMESADADKKRMLIQLLRAFGAPPALPPASIKRRGRKPSHATR